ncbi:hypothetical protein Syun_019939 [Stephania yunnanensis]|uniref:Cytochrome P450 n=1 Tax=Stephania yunnanensis TaxID=152371 RepID=A0AAP0IUX6_9MAGN
MESSSGEAEAEAEAEVKGPSVYVVLRDPKAWPEPNKFMPERFMRRDDDNKIKDIMFKFIPFGIGRRRCLGEGLAMHIIILALGSLLRCFEWDKIGGDDIDMSEEAHFFLIVDWIRRVRGGFEGLEEVSIDEVRASCEQGISTEVGETFEVNASALHSEEHVNSMTSSGCIESNSNVDDEFNEEAHSFDAGENLKLDEDSMSMRIS